MSTLYYFAYGSNLHPLRLQARLSSAQLIGTTILPGYALKFHKLGHCLSGKCNIVRTNDLNDTTYGAVFRIAAEEKPILDEIEGPGYHVEPMHVHIAGENYESFAYIAEISQTDDSLKPFEWYKSLVHLGSLFHRFPTAYTTTIESTEAITDPDEQRHYQHMQLINKMRA